MDFLTTDHRERTSPRAASFLGGGPDNSNVSNLRDTSTHRIG